MAADGAHNEVEIHYCPKCKWLLRSAWMAQELLATFEAEIAALTLRPAGTGVFEIHVNGERIWSRSEQGGFPEVTELKQLVRDRVAPERDLGHVDRRQR
jgi:selenoprotein W-related protein